MTLSEKRRSLDMSLGECARTCGLAPSVLSKIERGGEAPGEETCAEIAKALGWTHAEVLAALPTREEAVRDFARVSDALEALAAVQSDAKTHGLGRGNGGVGEIKCPICKGRLRYSVAGSNGHIWGACSNKDCVRWMQ